jgi:hypothetical protein
MDRRSERRNAFPSLGINISDRQGTRKSLGNKEDVEVSSFLPSGTAGPRLQPPRSSTGIVREHCNG